MPERRLSPVLTVLPWGDGITNDLYAVLFSFFTVSMHYMCRIF